MWDKDTSKDLSRRERQVIEIVMRRGRVTAREIEKDLPDAPTYSAVRSILRLLVEKKLLVKDTVGGRDEFKLPVPAATARTKALHQFVQNFFENSVADAVLALLGHRNAKLTDAEAEKLTRLIEEARGK
jgi:predicted transcriptional regulator